MADIICGKCGKHFTSIEALITHSCGINSSTKTNGAGRLFAETNTAWCPKHKRQFDKRYGCQLCYLEDTQTLHQVKVYYCPKCKRNVSVNPIYKIFRIGIQGYKCQICGTKAEVR
jgi:hypothetical protein